MSPRRGRRPVRMAAAVLFLSAGCADQGGEETSAGTAADAAAGQLPVDTLISTVSGVLGEPTDLDVDAQGRLFVLDRLGSQVHRVDETGVYLDAFGGLGEGPTELSRPGALRFGRADTLWVVDGRNGRLQAYDAEGQHLATEATHPWAALPSHVAADGRLVATGSGQDSTLAVLFDRSGERIRGFGVAPAPIASGVETRMSALAGMIAEGEVPPVFRNSAAPFVTPGGNLWVARVVDGVLERYAVDGSDAMPAATVELDEPELEEIRQAWIAENRSPESDGVSVLLLIRDLYATDQAVWVLLNRSLPEASILLAFDRDGQPLGRWDLPQVPGATTLAVDAERGRLFLGIAELAQVVALPLPG